MPTITATTITDRYAEAVADIAEQKPATNLGELREQLGRAIVNLDLARFETEPVKAAATYLDDAAGKNGREKTDLLRRADRKLRGLTDMCEEYMEMAGD